MGVGDDYELGPVGCELGAGQPEIFTFSRSSMGGEVKRNVTRQDMAIANAQ